MDNKLLAFARCVACILMVLTLSSCKHMSRKDGPPNFYVDETKIPDAVPKAEPLAKYGNYKTYTVFGKKYHTMQSSRNYNEVGTASWYGTKFDAQRTSSGERYNMLSMTAAHKTLPLPTYVQVTNLNNQRKIIVKVNDRGPFASNRLIDLSYVAAKKLGMLGHGTTPVRVQAIDFDTFHDPLDLATSNTKQHVVARRIYPVAARRTYKIHQNYANNSARLYLQVGAFKLRGNAEQMRNRLARMIDSPVYVAAPSHNSSLYRVKIGPFRDMASAKQTSHRLRGLGITSAL